MRPGDFCVLLMLAIAIPASGSAQACGYEDPTSVALGALNFTYPDALHVATAVWQARQQGLLGPAGQGVDARLQAMRTLYQLRRRLGMPAQLPALAIVFTPAVMWSRLWLQDERLALKLHVSRPAPQDVVMVTEPDALQAWLERRLTLDQLIDTGLVRLYGPPAEVDNLRSAFAGVEKSASPVLAQERRVAGR